MSLMLLSLLLLFFLLLIAVPVCFALVVAALFLLDMFQYLIVLAGCSFHRSCCHSFAFVVCLLG